MVLEALLEQEGVIVGAPATRADIDAVCEKFAAPMPELLLQLWRRSAGLQLDALDAHIPGPAEVLQVVAEDAYDHGLLKQGLVPILDDHQSNLLAVVVRDPLAFRVIHVPHDDGTRLIYRDMETYLSELVRVLTQGNATADSYFYNAEGEYGPDAPRPIEDQQVAKVLMSSGEDEEWNYAVQLLDATNLDEWARVLETDHVVRRDARARMQQMSSPEIRALLAKDSEAFEAFVTMAADAVARSGLRLDRRDGDSLRVGGHWMNLDAFFHRRNIPDALSRMVSWFEDVITGRDPRQRPRHYMQD